MKTTKIKNRRRDFLLAAGLGTAGVAAAVVARAPASGKADAAQPGADGRTGYRVSEHILKYYKTTEV